MQELSCSACTSRSVSVKLALPPSLICLSLFVALEGRRLLCMLSHCKVLTVTCLANSHGCCHMAAFYAGLDCLMGGLGLLCAIPPAKTAHMVTKSHHSTSVSLSCKFVQMIFDPTVACADSALNVTCLCFRKMTEKWLLEAHMTAGWWPGIRMAESCIWSWRARVRLGLQEPRNLPMTSLTAISLPIFKSHLKSCPPFATRTHVCQHILDNILRVGD